ncbi:DUF7288 family protein [Halohasta salina]|uniref:DUF7288 family protein n=1 Tax=Halohasta salina TaxID=2961621 RepID=UPI0020A52E6C|nr:hypothetical protein [Halohasta salina]
MNRDVDRGQAHTVEAFIAALLLLSALLFAMQATAVTPLSASTSNQHIENQQRALADGLLSTAADDGSLQETVLYWNASRGAFQDSGETGYYQRAGSQTAFLAALNETLAERRIAYNVRVRYFDANATAVSTDPLVSLGQPSDNAVTASRTITLTNESRLTGDCTSDCRLETEPFYASSVDDGQLYNRVEVRITTWRM